MLPLVFAKIRDYNMYWLKNSWKYHEMEDKIWSGYGF